MQLTGSEEDGAAATAGQPGTTSPRVALVLGAGGMAGIAFHAGVLSAISEATGWDPRTAELIIGTSAGSVTGSGLRAGLSAPDLLARVVGDPLSVEGAAIVAPADAVVDGRDTLAAVGPLRLAPAAPSVLVAAGRRLGRMRPGALMAGLLPAGRVPTESIAQGVDAMVHGWPIKETWMCALRLHDGELTVFGRAGAPRATLGQAVAASCAIPGFFSPVDIGGVRYVDGGAHSTTNLAEVPAGAFDLVIVSAPMARSGRRPSMPPGLPAALGTLGREFNRLQLGLEARKVRAGGTPVVAFSPTAADRAVIGWNPMDPSRRAPIARQARRSALERLERAELRDRLALLFAAAERR